MREERLIISYLREKSGDLVETPSQYFVGETGKKKQNLLVTIKNGPTVAQAVSRWLLTVASWD
jgi:hypothetical protein